MDRAFDSERLSLTDAAPALSPSQVEHHLFPGLNHEHLPTIAPVVRDTCDEFGVPYHAFASWSAIASEFTQHLRNLGEEVATAPHAKAE